jgi:hypothetical protein
MTTTQRTFVATRTARPDDAGWRFVVPIVNALASEADHPPIRRLPSLSWRLRH